MAQYNTRCGEVHGSSVLVRILFNQTLRSCQPLFQLAALIRSDRNMPYFAPRPRLLAIQVQMRARDSQDRGRVGQRTDQVDHC